MSKKVEIDGKVYELKEVENTEEEKKEEVVEEKEEETTPKPSEEKPTVEETEENVDEKIEEATEKVVASLGLDKLMSKMNSIEKAMSTKLSEKDSKKLNPALIDLEKLMNKSVKEMTAKEKIVGFFQAIVQKNEVVMKALSEGTAADGGYLFPDEFRAEIIRDMVEANRFRNEITIIPMKRDVMKIPSLESRPQVTWTEENATKSTTTAHFGEVTLTVKKMAAILYASDELIEDSDQIDIVKFIIGLFSEAIGEEEDRIIWRGNGTTQPTGIVTAQGAGTIAGRTCSGNLGIDDLLDLIYDLPNKYAKNSKIYVHRTNIRELRKLKDSNNRYYWSEPVSAGLTPTFLGYPVIETNELGEDQIYFGDLKKTYWLGDRQKMTVKVTQETETALNCEGSIKGMNCWKVLKKIISSQALPVMV